MVSQNVSFFLLLILSSLLVTVLSAEPNLEVEAEALKAFKNAITDDPLAALADWNSSNHHCNWSGITCDPSSNLVVLILIFEKHLTGQISPFLGNLSALQVLDLDSNSFSGSIPAQLGQCSQLIGLGLYNNSLSGSIPAELGVLQNLQLLVLNDNYLIGNIPESICNCSSLTVFSVSFNNLTGTIPKDIGNLISLQNFLAYRNKLVGSIPASIGRLRALQAFSLSQNLLSGTIPPEIGNLSNLEHLVLYENSFGGEIPSELGRCKELVALDLNDNQFTGSIPPELGNLVHLGSLHVYNNRLNSKIPTSLFELKSLTRLGLSQNEFTGTLPQELGSLRSLEWLTLHSNKFSGEIPSSITNLTNLTYLSLGFNSLTGELPSIIGLLYNLRNLTVNSNLLEGSIPSSITNCTHLAIASFAYNRITGKIPTGLDKLQNLTFLSFGENRMSGEIPDDLFNCSNLVTLDLAVNNFTGLLKPGIGKLYNLQRLKIVSNIFEGLIPQEIGNLSQLNTLTLAGNSFTGFIPPELSKISLLQGLSLGDNGFEGAIPEKLFELKQLTYLDLQNNKLTGPIPDAVSKLELLSHLNLQGNKLNGTIPKSMEGLDRLVSLDLSHNHLTGSAPGSVIASMKSLQEYLNLSYNLLEGSIPGELGKLEMVQAIDISNNHFSGSIPKMLEGCRNLFSLDLSGNKLSGSIPAEAFSRMDVLTSLNLSKNNLEGEIPQELTNLKHLSSLDLSQNKLKGAIPEGFAKNPTLKHLNLSFNQLEGRVPEAGIFRSINSSNLVGNPELCGTKSYRPCSRGSSNHLSKKTKLILLVLGSVSVLLILVIVISTLNRCAKKRKSQRVEDPEPEFTAALSLKRFDREELENATGSFSEHNILGCSSLSTVYKGQLRDGEIIAVKKLNLQQFSAESDKCFYREAKTLGNLRHRNLAKVLGYAWETRKLKALVLKYMENGSLEHVIHLPQLDKSRWTLSKRIDVFISIASGLDYLHSGYDFPIVHCDLKPSNILLDGDWEAHVSDFGTARMLGVHLQGKSSLSSASAFEGTIGYLAPEFAYMRTVTTKVDVFSFGIVMMEFLTKRRPTGINEGGGLPISLSQLVQKAIEDGINGILQISDPELILNISQKEVEVLEELFKLTLVCTYPNPEDRPNMNEVLTILLKGAIPEKLFELKQLTYLDLQNNKLTGPIPDAVSKLEFLSHLNLQGNKLNGSIPKSMEGLDRLVSLDLSHNHLTGSAPGSVIASMKSLQEYLNLSYNLLEGSIPGELGKLEMVQAIDISNNHFSGSIPKMLEGCRNLFSLDLSGNKLSDAIPAEAFSRMDVLTSLNLSKNNLEGEIPQELTNLKNLSSLDLSQNKLKGAIPEGFAKNPTLKHLNLSFNQLEGRVPEAGIFRSINASNLVGNPELCGTKSYRPCSRGSSNHLSKKTKLILLVLGSVSVLLILVLVISTLNRCAKKSNSKRVEDPEPEFTAALSLKRFDREELENATGSFSEHNILGCSSLSTVYKGQLRDGEIIAVKKLNLQQFSAESDKCFYREAKTLGNLRHRNLAKILGYAWETRKLKALVLKYMENGSLEHVIHLPQLDKSRWTLSKRIDVFISIASGLDYLHSGYDFPIVHCDLKPSNILLDGDWEAHVSDFGTARMLGVHLQGKSSLSSASAFEGTIGYLAPEFAYMRTVTTKVDVFSFGIVMMEFLTKRRPTGINEGGGLPISLSQLVQKAIEDGINGILQISDPELILNISQKEMEVLEELFKLTLVCTYPNPEDRPSMNEVLTILLKVRKTSQ
ncbi:hypothetical protein Dsin_019772 [Dipteronia sinensis]|uniref:non-specific serine/threonine protein kinase n=1 Tax=Dipteronia sinensis TaxID=43782 RepID=A0AAE0A9B6_9ROSI|nr:hypothetical protein Dsin_019772 [Dipteronia sinensis]